MQASFMRRLAPIAAVAAFSVLLVAPAALSEPKLHDSFWINWVWLDQFAAQLENGTIYPRWMPLSHSSLGSPVFYYYPPLAFYVSATFSIAGLSTYDAIIGGFWCGFFLSGITMFLWLRKWADRPLIGTLMFMAAPYHMLNFYGRGALAEFMATALIPLVALGMRRIVEERRGGAALTAAAYGLLIATHLPLALLVSVFFVAPYALLITYRSRRHLGTLLWSVLLGIMLSSAYLVPALHLDAYRDGMLLWRHPSLQPQNWSAWASTHPNEQMKWMIIAISGGWIWASIVLLKNRTGNWIFCAACLFLIGAGFLPWVWNLPIISSVQFPFRVLPVAEFAVATAVACSGAGPRKLTRALALPLVISVAIPLAAAPSQSLTITDLQSIYPDVPENLPPGRRPYTWPSEWAQGIARANKQPRWNNGVTVEPVFYFPAWKVLCRGRDTPTFPERETGLLSYRGRGCVRYIGRTDQERWGAAASCFSLFLLTLSLLLSVLPRAKTIWRPLPV
jgi:uncharacterized membrane protein